MRTIFLDKTAIHFPSELNECTPRQIELMMTLTHQKFDVQLAKFNLLMGFFHRNWALLWLFFKNDTLKPLLNWFTFGQFTFIQKTLTEAQLTDLLRISFDFIQDKETHLTKQLFPKIQLQKAWYFWTHQTLYGPADELKNINFKEFIPLDFMYLMYIKTQDSIYLNKLCAILYRPQHQEFVDDESIEQRAELMNHLSISKRLAIFEFVHGCRQSFIDKYEFLFPKPSTGTEKKEEFTFESIVNQYKVWQSVPAEFADKPNDISTQENVKLHTVLQFLNHKAKKNKELEEELARRK
jgi:hypothetical protein